MLYRLFCLTTNMDIVWQVSDRNKWYFLIFSFRGNQYSGPNMITCLPCFNHFALLTWSFSLQKHNRQSTKFWGYTCKKKPTKYKNPQCKLTLFNVILVLNYDIRRGELRTHPVQYIYVGIFSINACIQQFCRERVQTWSPPWIILLKLKSGTIHFS